MEDGGNMVKPKFLKFLKFTNHNLPTRTYFLLEGVRLGLDMISDQMGCTWTYCPFGLMIERSRIAPYHKKLLADGCYTWKLLALHILEQRATTC